MHNRSLSSEKRGIFFRAFFKNKIRKRWKMNTYHKWPDPEVRQEGIHLPLEHRPRRKRKRQIDWESILGGLIILFAVFGWYLIMFIFS